MNLATPKQIGFIESLVRDREIEAEQRLIVEGQIEAGLNRQAASNRIEWLLAQPKKEQAKLQPGVYENDRGVFVVKFNRAKTNLYAKRLVEIGGSRLTESDAVVQIEFEYDRGAIRSIRPEHKMPLEKAKELTIRYGRCIVCGRHLKAAQSVERGIGPVCIKSFA